MKPQQLPLLRAQDDDPQDRELAFSLGIAEYFVKPAALGRVRQIMDARRSYWSAAESRPPTSFEGGPNS